jgi:hypothetical protein
MLKRPKYNDFEQNKRKLMKVGVCHFVPPPPPHSFLFPFHRYNLVSLIVGTIGDRRDGNIVRKSEIQPGIETQKSFH